MNEQHDATEQPSEQGSPDLDDTARLTSEGSLEPARKPGPRTGPIVWGALILAFCGYIAQQVFGSAELDAGWWVATTTIALGALLLIVGIAVVIRGQRAGGIPRS